MSSHADSLTTSSDAPMHAFLLRAFLWSLTLFAAIRLAWIDRHVVGALVSFQQTLVFWYSAGPHTGILVSSSCSGADVIALCAGVLLAYPMAWGRRLAGAAVGMAVILTVNTIRIASLYAVASRPDTLNLLHLYVWPAVLCLVTVAYVFGWIRADARRAADGGRQWLRLACCSLGMLLLYAAAVPWVFTSTAVQSVGVWTAAAGRSVLSAAGVTAQASGSVLVTTRGAFQVTQECLFTPMLPLYVAVVCAWPLSGSRRAVWLLAALPIFLLLGVVRLLLLAVPPLVADTPAVLAHGFYQIVAGATAIVVAAHVAERSMSGRRATRRAIAALGASVAAAVCAALVWEPVLAETVEIVHRVLPSTILSLSTTGDRQGAIALLPAYQIGLLVGLWCTLTRARGLRDLARALGVVAVSQLAFLIALGSATAWLGVEPHALVIRGWALGVPLAIALLLATSGGTVVGDRSYSRFWHEVGEEFPALTGAPSTTYYFENEKRLIAESLPSLAGRTLLKTDLWDEAKNTRILQWAADQGARVYAIDLSEPIVRQARAAFEQRTLRSAVSDVRSLPFADGSFDAIYSMGTLEHFAETDAAVAELARVLKPGGRVILGVPNRHDPFLRPLMVALLYRIGLYGYGYEKSYSRRALRAMLEDAGLDVVAESGVLFVPGALRMLDLWFHTRARALTIVTGALLRPFVWFDAHVPAVRRHGYLLASVGVKPLTSDTAGDAGHPRETVTRRIAPDHAVRTGVEYVVDARGCRAEALRSLSRLQSVFAAVIADLQLHPVAAPVWHIFPGEGGITGVVLLSESHLTIHTYPETELAAINLYSCRESGEWPWEEQLSALLGARDVSVRTFRRG